MKKYINILITLILVYFIPAVLPLVAGSPDNPASESQVDWMDREWRAYDVNADGKFDKQDIEELLADGWQTFDHDLNGDGIKDVNDVFALYVKLSVLDRNCNEAVADDDFKPVTPVKFPEADLERVWLIVNDIVPTARIAVPLPDDVEEQIFSSIKDSWKLSIAESIGAGGYTQTLQIQIRHHRVQVLW